MTGIENVNLGARIIPVIGLTTGYSKRSIITTP
jgi:hypothetical protein